MDSSPSIEVELKTRMKTEDYMDKYSVEHTSTTRPQRLKKEDSTNPDKTSQRQQQTGPF